MPKTSPEYALASQRRWLLEHFRSDRDVYHVSGQTEELRTVPAGAMLPGRSQPTCRCFRCGKLLGERALFVSLVDPNGTTRRSNIRPACAEHAL